MAYRCDLAGVLARIVPKVVIRAGKIRLLLGLELERSLISLYVCVGGKGVIVDLLVYLV